MLVRHAPQWLGFDVRSTQTPPHMVCDSTLHRIGTVTSRAPRWLALSTNCARTTRDVPADGASMAPIRFNASKVTVAVNIPAPSLRNAPRRIPVAPSRSSPPMMSATPSGSPTKATTLTLPPGESVPSTTRLTTLGPPETLVASASGYVEPPSAASNGREPPSDELGNVESSRRVMASPMPGTVASREEKSSGPPDPLLLPRQPELEEITYPARKRRIRRATCGACFIRAPPQTQEPRRNLGALGLGKRRAQLELAVKIVRCDVRN